MASKKLAGATTLKVTINPKRRGNIVELRDVDTKTLTPREKLMLRTINDLEDKLDRIRDASDK